MDIRPASDIKKVLIPIEGTNRIMMGDLIMEQGLPWLVPEWLDAPSEGWTTPKRIVLAAAFGPMETGKQDYQYLLQKPVPQALLDGAPTQAPGQKILERPDIRFERLTIQ